MSIHEKRFTHEQLENLEANFRYMVLGQGFTLLIVDSNHTQRRTLGNQLKQAGVDQVREAKSASEAIIEAGKTKGTIVFLVELNLPTKDGIALTKEIRASERWQASKIILCSDEQRKERIVSALRSGADAFLKKPLTPDMIVAKLEEFGYHVTAPKYEG